MRGVSRGLCAGAPYIDADEQEQPDHIDEMPVPGGKLETEMLLRRELPGIGAQQADRQEDCANDHVEAVEAGGHEEGRAIDVARVMESRVAVLIGLDAGKGRAEQDGEDQAP